VLGLGLLPLPLFVLAVLPGGPAVVQVGGIALVWWYGVLVGPVLALVIATLALVAAGE
jgi:hypothetical protein